MTELAIIIVVSGILALLMRLLIRILEVNFHATW